MLFAPDSKLLQRTWFDKIWQESRADAVEEAFNAKLKQLEPMDQQRVLYLREQKKRIHQLAQENPSLTVDLMGDELAKLEAVVASTGLPVIDTGHRVVGSDACHFMAPVSMPDEGM